MAGCVGQRVVTDTARQVERVKPQHLEASRRQVAGGFFIEGTGWVCHHNAAVVESVQIGQDEARCLACPRCGHDRTIATGILDTQAGSITVENEPFVTTLGQPPSCPTSHERGTRRRGLCHETPEPRNPLPCPGHRLHAHKPDSSPGNGNDVTGTGKQPATNPQGQCRENHKLDEGFQWHG